MRKFLFLLGLLFLVESGLITYLAERNLSGPPDNRLSDAETRIEAYDAHIESVQLLNKALGAQFGCLGSWLLAMYLKVRGLERKVAHGNTGTGQVENQ